MAPGGAGNGTPAAPFGRVQQALAAAAPGDTVLVAPGTYRERIASVRAGASGRPITVRARGGRGTVTITADGRVATIAHPYITFDGLVFDGQFGEDDVVRVGRGGTAFVLRNCEVRRTSRDGIDIGAAHDVLIEGSLVHHTLNAAEGRTDAHGIVAGAARRLRIRDTEVHTFSGDAFQIDPGRAAPGWDDVVIEGCRFWLAPLPEAVNGFAAGAVPGENAVDTKVGRSAQRPRLVIRNTEAHGFRDGLIPNMAAFNIKEDVDAVLDGVTVHSSEIAFRLRGPARVRVQNAVVHDVDVALRYEDDIQDLRLWNSTFGTAVRRPFVAAAARAARLDVRNLAVLGETLPAEAKDRSNLLLRADAFLDPARHDYRLSAGSPAIDAGTPLEEVRMDRAGIRRPQGARHDVGAYEREKTRPAGG